MNQEYMGLEIGIFFPGFVSYPYCSSQKSVSGCGCVAGYCNNPFPQHRDVGKEILAKPIQLEQSVV